MASTKFAIIYSKATGRIRWYLRSDDDSDHQTINLLPGEALMELPNELWNNHIALQEHVNKHTGKVPKDDRYAIVHPNGDVVGAILADPKCGDKIEGHQLISHPEASAGWRHHPQKGFIKPEEAKK